MKNKFFTLVALGAIVLSTSAIAMNEDLPDSSRVISKKSNPSSVCDETCTACNPNLSITNTVVKPISSVCDIPDCTVCNPNLSTSTPKVEETLIKSECIDPNCTACSPYLSTLTSKVEETSITSECIDPNCTVCNPHLSTSTLKVEEPIKSECIDPNCTVCSIFQKK